MNVPRQREYYFRGVEVVKGQSVMSSSAAVLQTIWKLAETYHYGLGLVQPIHIKVDRMPHVTLYLFALKS